MILMALALAINVRAGVVTGNVRDAGLVAQATNVYFTPKSTPMADSPSVIISAVKTAMSDTNGDFSITLAQGNYKVTIGSNTLDSFLIAVPSGTNTNNWTSITVGTLTYKYPFSPVYLDRTIVSSRGDLWGYDGTNPTRVGVGTHGQYLGVDTNQSVGLKYGNPLDSIINTNGYLMIGLTNPSGVIHIRGTGPSFIDRIGSGAHLVLRCALGTTNNPTNVIAGTLLGSVSFQGYSTQWEANSPGGISGIAAEDWTTTQHGADLYFRTAAIGGVTVYERMRIKENGNVGINTTNPTERLQVIGNISVASNIYANAIYATNGVIVPGATLQTVNNSSNDYRTLTTQIPLDDTIPQNTEGTEVVTASITPKSTNSTIIIQYIGCASSLGAVTVTVGVFKDSDADSIGAEFQSIGATAFGLLNCEAEYTNTTLTAKTFKIRIGPSTATSLYINGSSAARLLGGTAKQRIMLQEIQK